MSVYKQVSACHGEFRTPPGLLVVIDFTKTMPKVATNESFERLGSLRYARTLADVFFLFLLFCGFGASSQTSHDHTPRMSFIDNGLVRLGVDLNLGGAITYLSRSGANSELNIINSHDWGRQAQLSYYSGPVPFQPKGVRMAKEWSGLGWNLVQSGDCFGHASKVLQHTNEGHSLYLKCVPMQWPLENVPGECECEIWLILEGPVVKARCRLTHHRADQTQYPARNQELPVVYVNAPFYHLMTYSGGKPFTGDALSAIRKRPEDPGFWSHFTATENWAAAINDEGWGLGVWNPDTFEFNGGFFGAPGVGGPLDNPTGYIGPLRTEIIDHNIIYDYRYQLIVGTIKEIRNHVYKHTLRSKEVSFTFENDRQGWHYFDATDAGWPIKNELDIFPEGREPQIISPVFFVRAEDAPRLKFVAAFETGSTNAQIYWRRLDGTFSEDQSLPIEVWPDGKFHRFDIDLSTSSNYSGSIVQLRIKPLPIGHRGARLRLKSLALSK